MTMQLDPLRFAKFYAAVMHAGKLYGGGLPYTHHLSAVEQVARRFRPDIEQEVLEACWLHDSVEDTAAKVKDIKEMFGPKVAELVAAVTNEPGANRKIRGMLTYPKIREADPRATFLKLCDRIANVEHGGNMLDVYRKEYEDFRRALFTPGYYEDMWTHLDGLLR